MSVVQKTNKLKKKLKLELPKTFETAKSVELTKKEKSKLSRERILNWYRRKKYEKLKGLQAALIEATYSEREEIKKTIVENTKAELAKHKEIVAEERNKRAERFAEEIVGVAEGIGNIDIVIRKYEKLQLDEDVFFATLKGYVGKRKGEKNRKLLKRMAASPHIGKIFTALKDEMPSKAKEIEIAMKEGDIKKVRKMMAEASGGRLSEKEINTLLVAPVFKNFKFEKKTGVGVIDQALNVINAARNVGHLTVLNKAAKELKVPFMFLTHLGTRTLRDIQNMDDNLQRNKYLIENKGKQSILDADRLEFIRRIHELRRQLDGKAREKGIQELFKNSLHNYLKEKKGLTDADRIQIENQSHFEDLRLIQIFNLVYGGPEDRERWFIKSLSRIPTIMRFHKQVFGEQSYVNRTIKRYHAKRIAEWSTYGFSKNARKWQMGKVLKNMDDIEKLIGKGPKFGQIEFDTLFKRAHGYEFKPGKINEANRLLADEMLEHDNLVKRYHGLVQQATAIMTKEAKQVLEAGKGLQQVQKGAGKGFLKKNLTRLPHLSDQTLETLLGKKVSKINKTAITGGDLIAAYSKRIVDVKGMQEITRTRFAVLAETIDAKVVKPFGSAWAAKLDFAKGASTRSGIVKNLSEIKSMVRPTPAKYYAKRYGLPAIIVGVEMYYLATGKAKASEVVWDLGEAAAGFIPILGTALDLKGVITGKSLSGKKLSTKERWMYAGFATIGAVADIATIFGGIGLGLRAGVGGVRSGRRAVQAGKALDAANTMRKVAYVENAPFLQRQIAKAASWLTKAKRADAATEMMMTARAMEQANLIGSLGKNYRGIEDMSKLGDLIKKADKVGDVADVAKLRKLQKFYKEVAGGIDYMKVMKKYGNAIDIPRGIFGKAWYATLAGFKKIKAKLLGIGISADVLRTYEKSFDAVKAAQATKARAVLELADLYKLKHLEQTKHAEAFAELYNKGSNLGKAEKRYAKLVKQSREASRKTISLNQRKKQLQKQYNSLKEAREAAQKAAKKSSKRLGGRAGKEVSQSEVDAAKKLFDNTNAEWGKSMDATKGLNSKKAATGRKISADNATWKKSFDNADRSLMNIDAEILVKEGAVRSAESFLHNANTTRSFIQAEMMQKATKAARTADRLTGVTRFLQTGGIVTGCIWAFTGFNYGPAEQYKAAKKYVPKGAKLTGKVAHELFIADHSGQPAIDQMVEARVQRVTRKKYFMRKIEKAREVGENPAIVFARNWEDDAVKELAKKHGYYDKVQKLLAEGKVKVQAPKAPLKDIISGDSARRLKEKILG